MELVKEKIANNIRGLVERLGYMINPILLKIIGEDSQVLVFLLPCPFTGHLSIKNWITLIPRKI